jgi:hypothetical protein
VIAAAAVALALALVAGPALALDSAAAQAARCAALFYGMADFQRAHPRLTDVDPALATLAGAFRDAAVRLAGDAGAADAAIADQRPGMALLMKGIVLYAGRVSAGVFERLSRTCARLERALPETRAPQ